MMRAWILLCLVVVVVVVVVLALTHRYNEGYIVSVHRMVMENRPVGSIQGSHRPISFIRIKHRTRANDILCKTEYS